MTELKYDFVPVLSAGNHEDPANGACVMEMVSFMSGDKWSDAPDCTLPIIAGVAQSVNDHVGDEWRGDIMKDFHRLFGTNDPKFAEEATFKIEAYLRSIKMYKHAYCYCMFDDMNTGKMEHKANCYYGFVRFERQEFKETRHSFIDFRMADYAALGVLTRVLDIYDEVAGRNEYLIQDVSKLADLECQKVNA